VDLNRRRGGASLALAIVTTLAVIATMAPSPWYITERDIFRQIGRDFFIPDCSSLHCTRLLASWILEQLPGPSLLKWKIYAVVGGTLAAIGTARLARQVGLQARVGNWAAWLVAFGSGVQITLFDPYGPDPFIYAITPWLLLWVIEDRIALAASIAAVGVFAKEFAAAPLWIGVGYSILARRRDLFWRCSAAAVTVTLIWVAMQIALILRFNYSYGGNASAMVFEGGYVTRWFRLLGPTQSLAALALHVVPVVALAAVAVRRAPRELQHLALASMPPLLALAYVQQPDRAIWNFQPVLASLAAMPLVAASPAFAWTFVAGYAGSNLRVVPQVARLLSPVAFVVCVVGAVGVVFTAVSRCRTAASAPEKIGASDAVSADARPVRGFAGARVAAIVSTAALAFGLLWAADIFAHRRGESGAGVNIWGYRGPVIRQKAPDEIRVVVLGGSTAFGRELTGSIPLYLEDYLNNARLRGDASYQSTSPITVVNLATPYDHVGAFERTLDDYAWLRDDIVCLYIGHDDPAPSREAAQTGWRRQSAIFRTSGYLPFLPSLVARHSADVVVHEDDDDYLAALDRSIVHVLANGRRVIVVTHPFLTPEENRRQDVVSARLRDRFHGDQRGRYVDLRRTVSQDNPKLVEDGTQPTPLGNSVIAESLSQSVFRLLERGG
jgi:hypothetical protein